jgi:hypothetical protein
LTWHDTAWHIYGVEKKTRTEAEAIADILAMLYQRVRDAERYYQSTQRDFPLGSVERREGREVMTETREAYNAVRAIAETVN